MIDMKMEGWKEGGDLVDFKILEVEYSKSWATRKGEVPLYPMFLLLPKVEDMLISLGGSQDIN